MKNTTVKRGPGRPRLMAKTRRIIIQVNDTELKLIQGATRNNNISVSQFMRKAADHALANPYIVFG